LIQGALACTNNNDIDHEYPDISINLTPDCNNVGYCYTWFASNCVCCNTAVANDPCKGLTRAQGFGAGTFTGEECGVRTSYLWIEWGILVYDDDLFCPNNGSSPAIPNYVSEVTTVLKANNYSGITLARKCQICTPSDPCDTLEVSSTTGTLISFASDLNTYYDPECGRGDLPPQRRGWGCDLNFDDGAEAYLTLNTIVDKDNDFKDFTAALLAEVDSDSVAMTQMYRTSSEEESKGTIITRGPTRSPTSAPTIDPTPSSSDTVGQHKCQDYVNKVGDLQYLGGGASCRAHINESWPGGRTCESPYIICLPEENTPAFHITGKPYKNNTHRYTIEECKQECSYDQRCLGIEFIADRNSTSGDCLLLDDLEPKIEDEDPSIIYSDTETYASLDNSTTGVNALCWSKLGSQTYCNPFFHGDDLTDEMLRCYCPNNRKGFYTKKVKRTVNNTRFCDNDSSVDERIRMAQANRMFHLCENWCLFDPLQPEQENWYYDPWKQCWRETYSARGSHRGYCDRVIRNPNSIELRYINHRSTRFCDTSKAPTSSPVEDVNTTWYLSDTLESCDEVCGRNGLLCAAEQTSRRFKTESELISAFGEAGFDCTSDSVRIFMNETRFAGWALPGLRGSTICVNRQPTIEHLMDMDSDCVRKTGFDWQRLCACY